VDMPPGVQQRRREFVPLVFESSGYVAKLARVHIKQWVSSAERMLGGRGAHERTYVPWYHLARDMLFVRPRVRTKNIISKTTTQRCARLECGRDCLGSARCDADAAAQ
jgi:hypothetical protein